jgi:galactose-1-phosphate uridylyltransferase
MKLQSIEKETTLLDPRKGMSLVTITSQIREDPLTGRTARICHFMPLKWTNPDFQSMVAGTEKKCPFCAEHVMSWTPAFDEKFIAEGRMTMGDMVLFPNIAPYDGLSACTTMGHRHFIPINELSAERIARAFSLCFKFFSHIETLGHPESVYHLINWNYMPPSGSSLIHPHLQVFATSSAPNLLREELLASKNYSSRQGSNFWEDWIEFEKAENRRFLGSIGRTHWMCSYAPLGIAGDVMAIVDHVGATLELTDIDLTNLAKGLVRLLSGYSRMGIYSFNMNFFTGRKNDDFYRFHLVFSPRAYFSRKLGTPDCGAIRHLYNETLCMAYPEEIAERLRDDFSV